MIVRIAREQLMEVEPGILAGDASEVGLAPGQWPQWVVVDGTGNGQAFALVRYEPGVCFYRQKNGAMGLRLFND